MITTRPGPELARIVGAVGRSLRHKGVLGQRGRGINARAWVKPIALVIAPGVKPRPEVSWPKPGLCALISVWLVLLATCVGAPVAAGADAASPWTPGKDAVGEDTLTGFIDTPISGASVSGGSAVQIQGWVVDRAAQGWSGIDDVQIYRGLQDQGGSLLTSAGIGQRRDDVATALGNPFWSAAGFSASFPGSNLGVGSNVLSVYAHTPGRGWWYKQIELILEPLPDIGYADDPLLVVREARPSLDVAQTTQNLTLRGYVIDRNLPMDRVLGVGGSGVSLLQIYLDGPRQSGTFLGNPQMGITNREATGFGARFRQSGWEITVHPGEFSVDKHEFYIYAASAYWPNETILILPFNVH